MALISVIAVTSFVSMPNCDLGVYFGLYDGLARQRPEGAVMAKRLTDGNRLSLTHPAVAAEWHPGLNGDLTSDQVAYGSGIKRWWLCVVGHVWPATPNSRTSRKSSSGCPYCAGKLTTPDNNLLVCRPDVAAEWHPTLNGELKPDQVTPASTTRVWWLCPEGHENELAVYARADKRHKMTCSECSKLTGHLTDKNRLSSRCPELATEWHPTLNGSLTPEKVSYASARVAWWLCANGHVWPSAVLNRGAHGAGCRRCSKLSDDNRLSLRNPDVAAEWHPTCNGDLKPADFSHSSHEIVFWLCPRGHKWRAMIKNRTRLKSGCPKCAGKEVSDLNRLSLRNPKLVAQWHPTRNGDLTPDDVSYGSSREVWWICDEGHPFPAVVSSRALGGHGCATCAGQKVTDANRLSIREDAIAAEWHPTLNNGLTPFNVTVASNRKVWWLCANGHEWPAVIASRTYGGNGCGRCGLTGRSAVEVRLACELASLFPDIEPENTTAITVNGQTIQADIVILKHNLVIEYDGARWHCDQFDRDVRKTVELKAAGWRVLRIRERPMSLIEPTDMACAVTFPNDIKRLADGVLRHLDTVFGISPAGLSAYLRVTSVVNQAWAYRIITSRYDYQLRLFGDDLPLMEAQASRLRTP